MTLVAIVGVPSAVMPDGSNHPVRAVFLPRAAAVAAVGIEEPGHDLTGRRIAADDLCSAGQFAVLVAHRDLHAEKMFVGHPFTIERSFCGFFARGPFADHPVEFFQVAIELNRRHFRLADADHRPFVALPDVDGRIRAGAGRAICAAGDRGRPFFDGDGRRDHVARSRL